MKLKLIVSLIIYFIVSYSVHAQVAETVIYHDTTVSSSIYSPVVNDSIFVHYDSSYYFCAQRLDSIGFFFGGGWTTTIYDTAWVLYAYDGANYTMVYDSKTNPAIKPKGCIGTKYNKLFIELASGIGYYDGNSIVPLNNVPSVQEVSFLNTYMMLHSDDPIHGGLYKYDGNSVVFVDSLISTILNSVRPVVIGDVLYFKAIEKGMVDPSAPGLLDPLWKYDGTTLTKIESSSPSGIVVITYLTPYHGNLYYNRNYHDSTSFQLIESSLFRYDGNQKQKLNLDNDSLHYGLNVVGDYLYYNTGNTPNSPISLYQYHDSSSSSTPIFTPYGQLSVQSYNNTFYSLGPVPILEYDQRIYYGVTSTSTTFIPFVYDFVNPTTATPLTSSTSFKGFYNVRSTIDNRSTVDAAIADGKAYFNTGGQLVSYDRTRIQIIPDQRGAYIDGGNLQVINGEVFLVRKQTQRLPTLMKLRSTSTYIFSPTSIQDLKVFPNPTTGQITLQTTAKIETVQVLNVEGKVVLTPSVDNINISNLAAGVYILHAQTNEGTMYQKIVKE